MHTVAVHPGQQLTVKVEPTNQQTMSTVATPHPVRQPLQQKLHAHIFRPNPRQQQQSQQLVVQSTQPHQHQQLPQHPLDHSNMSNNKWSREDSEVRFHRMDELRKLVEKTTEEMGEIRKRVRKTTEDMHNTVQEHQRKRQKLVEDTKTNLTNNQSIKSSTDFYNAVQQLSQQMSMEENIMKQAHVENMKSKYEKSYDEIFRNVPNDLMQLIMRRLKR